MLEERWRQTVRRHAEGFALHDAALNRSWTFAELAAAADAGEPEAAGGFVCPRGGGVDFVLAVLRTWRKGLVVCPLEPAQMVPPVVPPSRETAHLKLTSGTTGAPRAVAFTAAQLTADADNIVATMGLRADWPNLGVISLAHSYGFSNLVTPLLLHGIPLILLPTALPAAVQAAAGRWPALTLPAVPALWRAWHEAGAIPPAVKLAISAGAPLPLPLEQRVFADHGLKLHNFLGASECGGIAYDPTPEPRQDARWVGFALRGVTLARDDDGCLVVTGAAVGQGYWPEPDARLDGHRYASADLVEFADDGALLLRGRLSDVINVAGRKISPEAIEAVLRRHPGVAECLVLGLPSAASHGEQIAAVVQPRGGVAEGELRQFLLAQLPAWQVPRVWHLVDSLAPDGRGKLSRAEWRRRLL